MLRQEKAAQKLELLTKLNRCETLKVPQVFNGHTIHTYKIIITTKYGYTYVLNVWHPKSLHHAAIKAIEDEEI